MTGGSASFVPNLSTGVLALNFSSTTINGPGTITNPAGQTLTLDQAALRLVRNAR